MAKRVKGGDKKLAIAYMRVSTDKERQALGAEAQRHAIEAWAAQAGVTIVAWHTEEVSGSAALDVRTGLLEALADVDAHRAGYLVVQRLDRFSRDPMSAGLAERELIRYGAELAIAVGGGAGDDPSAELMRGILLVMARFEKRMISARIKAALAVKKRRGERTGECLFGFEAESKRGKLVPNANEQAIIARVHELAEGGLTQRAIASQMAAEGVVGRSGKPLSQTQIGRVLRLPRKAAA